MNATSPKRPAPLTPRSCDLRDYPYIPLQIQRLKQSRAWSLCKRNPALAFYLLNIWTSSFQSVPAGSLESDPITLADLAMCDDDTWAKVKDDVLRGWVECEDGRIYHPVVAEVALEGLLSKLAQRKATDAATAARTKTAFDPKPYDAILQDALQHLRTLNPEARALKKRGKSSIVAPYGDPYGAPDGLQPDAPSVHQEEVIRVISPSEDKSSSGERAPARPPAPARLDDPSHALSPSVTGDRGHGDQPGATGGSGAEIIDVSRAIAKPAARRKRVETHWPDDLVLGDVERKFAEDRGYRGTAAVRLWESFENRSKSRGVTFIDWPAAWRSYVLKQLEFDAKDGGRKSTYADGRIRGRPPDI